MAPRSATPPRSCTRAARSGFASCARSSTWSKATGTSATDQPAAGSGSEEQRPAGPRTLGILGGTFNPPHLGHLAVARHAREELGLDRVMLVPVHTPPHKPAEEDPGPEHRLRMCELCVGASEGIAVSRLEIDRRGPSYTVDTLTAIHASHPEAHLTFIVGADTASTMAAWREPARLLELADLAVAARTGSARRAVLETVAGLTPAAGRPAAARVRFLEMPPIAISSSCARERVARGEPIEDLVGPAVAAYIAEHGLYRAAAAAPAPAEVSR